MEQIDISNSPATITARIGALLTAQPAWPAPDATPAERRARDARVQAMNEELQNLRDAAARLFGAERGWRLTGRTFDVTTLAGRRERLPGGRLLRVEWPPVHTDHRFAYRHVDRCPAALVAHLYDCNEPHRADLMGWAASQELVASFPDWPSWWYPGRTTLVLFETGIPPRRKVPVRPSLPPRRSAKVIPFGARGAMAEARP